MLQASLHNPRSAAVPLFISSPMTSDALISAPRDVALAPELEAVARAFREAGAVSPADARPLAAIPDLDPAAVVTLAARGVVREGAPGRFFLHTGTEHARRERRLTAVLIGAASGATVVGLPLLAWLLTR
jgi:hypothetical protein